MQKGLLHILPFESLIKSLKNQGFAIGVDSHLRIRALLEDWEGEEEGLEALKVQMGVILARDEEEQAHFYRVFNNYVEKYSYDPSQKIILAKKSLWRKYGLGLLFSLLALFLIFLMGYIGWENSKGPRAKISWAQQAGRHTLWLEDSSTVKTLGGLIEDEIVSRTWSITSDSGKVLASARDALFSHTFEKEGRYLISLAVESKFGTDTLQEEIRIAPAYSAQISTSKATGSEDNKVRILKALKFPFAGDSSRIGPMIREKLKNSWQVEWEENFSWSFTGADKTSAEGDSVSLRFNSPGQKEVKLSFLASSGKGNDQLVIRRELKKTITIEEQIGSVALEVVRFGAKSPEAEDIEDLLKAPKAPLWPWLICLLLLGLYGLNELYLYLMRRPILDSSQSRGPPMSEELKLSRPEWKLFDSDGYDSAMLKLRERKTGESEELNLPESLQATLDAGGLPAFVWKNREEAPQYLFLIEEKGVEDQQARYFEEWVRKLNDRDISAEYFFYEEELDYLWKDRNRADTEVELGRIAAEYNNYRLLIIGSGEALLHAEDKGLYPLADILRSWRERAFLSTKATENWGWKESLIESLLPVLPVAEGGISAITDQWNEHSKPNYQKWMIEERQAAAPYRLDEYIQEELKNYLGSYGYAWLCTCAVYPELYWELTLRLGELVQEHYEINKEHLPLERLIRLPWFQKGKLPRELRLLLYKELDPALAKKVRAELILILSQPQNQAAKDSYARQQQETTLAIYTYLNSDQQGENLEDLKEELLKVSPHSIQDVVSVQSIADLSDNPLAIVLPRRFFRGGIKLYGTGWKLRLGILLGALLLFGLGYFFLYQPSAPDRISHPYPMKEYDLTNAQDSGRYALYAGYHAYDTAQYDQAEIAFENAKDLLQGDDKFLLAKANLAKSRFRIGKALYDANQFALADSAFSNCCIDTCVNAARYARGLSLLNVPGEVNTQKALGNLIQVGEAWYADSNNLKSLYLQNPEAKKELGNKLLSIDQGDLQQNRNTLLRWIQIEWQDIEAMLQEADSLFSQANYPEALNAYNRVLFLEPNNVEAQKGIDACKAILTKQSRLSDLLNRANVLANNNDCEGAVSLYNQILQAGGDSLILRNAQRGIQRCDSINQGPNLPNDPERSAPELKMRNIFFQIDSDQEWGAKTEFIAEPIISFRGYKTVLSDVIFRKEGFMMEVPDTTVDFINFFFAEDSNLIQIDYANKANIPIGDKDTILIKVSFPPSENESTQADVIVPGIIDPNFAPTKMVRVEGGTFMMGSNEYIDEKPIHEVTLSTYFIDEHEVTNAQFVAFLNEEGNQIERDYKWCYILAGYSRIRFDGKQYKVDPEYESRPVVQVSWYGAKAYAAWLSTKTNKDYSLPTEAQWEYAAKGGNRSKRYTYSGSNNLRSVGWFRKNSNQPNPVKEKKANELRIFDMSGNASEWCLDMNNSYSPEKQTNPQGPDSGYGRVIRGGSFFSLSVKCRVSDRNVHLRGDGDIGFRLVRTP